MDSVTFWKIIAQSLLSITVGIFIFRHAYNQPKSKWFETRFKGYVAGVGFILFGIIHLLNKFHLG
jgi:uncharacterized membrane protein HdeD (DUF308 family)